MQIQAGQNGLLNFLEYLESKKVAFSLHRYDSESVYVFLSLYGKRIEVAFFKDHWNYSVFTGNEDVENESAKLIQMIEEDRA